MKNTKQFFAVFLSVIVCVLAVFAITYATTTISTNIQTEGTTAVGGTNHSTELSVVGTASISQDLWASGSFQFGGGETVGTVSYSRLGGEVTSHGLASASDLLVSNLLEVDASASFDNGVSVSAEGIILDGGAEITTGIASISTDCIIGSVFIDTVLGTVAVCDGVGVWSLITVE